MPIAASACSSTSPRRSSWRSERDRDVLRDRPQREDPVGMPVTGHDRDRAVDRRVGTRPIEDAQQHLGLALSRQARQSDDLAFMGDEADRLAGPWVRAHSDRQLRAIAARRDPLVTVSGMWPIALTSDSRSKVAAAASATTRPSRITTIRSAVVRISPRRCEMRIVEPPSAQNRRTNARSWPATTASRLDVGSSRMTSRAGRSVTVKARAISTICRRVRERSLTISCGEMP